MSEELLKLCKEYENKYGVVEKNGFKYYITQTPYVYDDGLHYTAIAINCYGDRFRIMWPTTIDWDNRDIADQWDESEACDWGKFEVFEL